MVLALFAIACLAATELGEIVLPIGAAGLPAFWPPSGLLLAALARTDRRRWPALVLIAVAVPLLALVVLHGRPVTHALTVCLIVSAEACVAAWLLQRLVEAPLTLNRVAHTWTLVLVAAVVPMAGGLVAGQVLDAGVPYWTVWRAWWLADAVGMLLIAPLMIAAGAIRSDRLTRVWSGQGLELAVALVGALVMAQGVFGDAFAPLMRVPAYILPVLLWPAFRLGPGGSAATVFMVSISGLLNTAAGHGPFVLAELSPVDWILRSQGAVLMAAVSLLPLASVVAERRAGELEKAQLVSDLQQALVEIKTLQGMIPICAWCHKVRDDAGFWQRLETYLDEKTDATVSHSICPSCADTQHERVEAILGEAWRI